MGREVRVRDVSYLWSLFREKRLQLRPEYQRNGIWPTPAKSYLIDSLIRGKPVPLIFLAPMSSAQTGVPGYSVVDGQQRLAAIFDYLDGRYRLSGSDVGVNHGKRFANLDERSQQAILTYGLVVEELPGYSRAEIVDVFVRLNKYGVRLSPQELRHARGEGVFKRAVEHVGSWPFWLEERVITKARQARMRSDELGAELLILLAEAGPQDKKDVIDQYYVAYAESFPEERALTSRLRKYLEWIRVALSKQPRSRFRKAVEIYSLVGALDRVSRQGERLARVPTSKGGAALDVFASELKRLPPTPRASRYLAASGRQTDNVAPRAVRIEVVTELLESVLA